MQTRLKEINLLEYMDRGSIKAIQERFNYKTCRSIYLALNYTTDGERAKAVRSYAINSILANIARFEANKEQIMSEFEQDNQDKNNA